MPPHSTRAATMESTVITSPAAACEAKATQPTSSAKVPWSATISRTRAPVRDVGPHEGEHVGEGRGPRHQRHGEIDHEARRDAGEVPLDEHRRRRSFDQPEREAEQPPGEDLAAVHAFRERAGFDGTAGGHAR